MGTIAQELTRIQTAKSDLKTSIENKGVSVPSNTLIDDYADYVDQITGGGGITEINDLKYMFCGSARLDIYSDVMNIANRNITDFTSFLQEAAINLGNVDLSVFPETLNLTNFLREAPNSYGILNIKNKKIVVNDILLGNDATNDHNDYSNITIDLENSEITPTGKCFISGGVGANSKDRSYYVHLKNLQENIINFKWGTLLSNVIIDDDILDLSNLNFSASSFNYSYYPYFLENVCAKNIILPNITNISNNQYYDYLYEYIYKSLLTVEQLTLPQTFAYSTQTTAITSVTLFDSFQKDVTDAAKMFEIDMEEYFPSQFLDRLAPTTNLFGDVNQYKISNGYGGPRGFINVHLTNSGQHVRPFGTNTTNVYNDICRFTLKDGTTWASNTYTSTCSLYLAYLWRGNASSIPDRDVEGKTTEEYFVEFLNSLGENTSGATRNIRIYSGLYNTISQETKQIAIDKGYTLVSTSTS